MPRNGRFGTPRLPAIDQVPVDLPLEFNLRSRDQLGGAPDADMPAHEVAGPDPTLRGEERVFLRREHRRQAMDLDPTHGGFSPHRGDDATVAPQVGQDEVPSSNLLDRLRPVLGSDLGPRGEARRQLLQFQTGVHQGRGIREELEVRHQAVERLRGLEDLLFRRAVCAVRLGKVPRDPPEQLPRCLGDLPGLILSQVALLQDAEGVLGQPGVGLTGDEVEGRLEFQHGIISID